MSKVELSNKWDLDHIMFIGRVWDEYMRMFNLSKVELLGRRILDCPAGACSFTAVSNQMGMDVTACDIAYYNSIDDLGQKGLKDIETTMLNMEKTEIQKNFIWEYFQSIKELKRTRTKALNELILDMKQNPEVYIPASLPSLPFEDKQFDLTLSANLLFLYSDNLDYDFHLQSIQELMRVTKREIRIFPTSDFTCKRYEYMDKLICTIQNMGWNAEEIKVPYEFQKNTNTMLMLTRRE